jgi:hypothetical protein
MSEVGEVIDCSLNLLIFVCVGLGMVAVSRDAPSERLYKLLLGIGEVLPPFVVCQELMGDNALVGA